ncbi:MAG: preprotein translocase subunit SecE [Phycisphaeraceae bacterium]|nr:preprotein translocase subunit SecE [Phycisphaerales bacterium]MCB9860907.1 preprotein translocase subunit SecE [Phycisphaeraceae bacterium]
MSFGIYKQGQGYWVRTLTAVFIGTLFLACAAWLFNEGTTLANVLPRASSQVYLENPDGVTPSVGDVVHFFIEGENGSLEEAGSATVQGKTDTGSLLIDTMSAGAEVSNDKIVRIEGPNDFAAVPSVIPGKPVIEPIFISGGLAALTILIGAIAVYYYVGVHKKSSEFLIATDIEMRRVNWSTRKDVIRSTVVVIVASFAIAASLFFVDFFFEWLFSAMRIRRM